MEITEERKEKKSNAENNKAYRERKKEEINARRREQRNANRAIKNVAIEYEVKKLKKIGRLPEVKQKEGLADITKNNYISYIKNFYKKNNGEELKESSEIIKKIRGEEYNSLKISMEFNGLINDNIGIIKENPTDVKNIYSIFRDIRGFTEISKILYIYSNN
jgi:predicted metal-dependent hydrolase